MSISTASIPALLYPGLRDLTGRYEGMPVEWPEIFQRGTSEMALERTGEISYLPIAQIKNEGAATAFNNNSGVRFIYNQQHVVISLGYAMTQEAIEDNLYKSQFGPTQLGLQESFKQTEDIFGATVLNTSGTYQTAVGGDGQALCSTAHPIDGSTYANRPSTDLDLNETSLESANIALRYFKSQSGLRTAAKPNKLVIPPQLKYVATRLLETELRSGTANNDINAMRKSGDFKGGIVVNDYLTSAFAWFVLTDKKGLLYLERAPFETIMWADENTGNVLVKGRKRFSFSYNDPRSIYGSLPTA